MKINSKSALTTSKKYFILSVVLLPLLFQYATPISSFTVGDAFMVFSWVYLMISTKKTKVKKSLCYALVYIVLITFVYLMDGLLTKSTTSLRYIVYLLIMVYFPTVENNQDYYYKTLNWVGIFVMIVLYVQYVALYTVGIIVPGVLTFLPLTQSSFENYAVAFSSAGRCMSVFAEPSHYAIFIILFIAYRLFLNEGLSFRNIILPVLASISIVLCSSFTGVIMMAAVWALKVFYELKSKRISSIYIMSSLIVFGIMFFIIMNTSLGSYITDEEVYERQSIGRFAGYNYMFSTMDSSTLSFIFGNGMNDIGEIEYLPGWPRLVLYFGLIGSLIYVLSFLSCAKWNTFSFVLLIIIAGLMIGTEMNFGPFIMPYMMLIILSNKSLILEKKNA